MTADPPRVSVVVTTLATPASLLEAALDSLLGQTLTDLEVVVVADGPLDPQAAAVVANRRRHDGRLVLVEPGRVGRPRALNVGIAAARAPLVAIQDADDASHPRRLELQASLFGCLPDLAALGTGAVVGGATSPTDWELPGGSLEVRSVEQAMLWSNPIVHSSLVVRAEALAAVGGYDEARQAQLDYDLLLRLRQAGFEVARCEQSLVLHRRHPDQFFEGLAPVARARSSVRLQLDHIAREPMPQRLGYQAVAGLRFAYQVGRGVKWHRAAGRARRTRAPRGDQRPS